MKTREMTPVPTTIYRCGTSKGIFLHENDLPADPEIRDQVILSIFGSPDPRQIDGLGGAEVLTSKLAIIGPGSVAGADVDYTFGQVDITTPYISYSGLCGNISAGVAPFAIEEGLVRAVEPVTTVRVYNKNTDQIFIAEVPVVDNMPVVDGDYVVPGVPGTGARLTLDMVGTIGSIGRGLLPTGHVKDVLDVPGIGKIEGSLVDAVNPCFFIKAETLGLRGDEVKKTDFIDGMLDKIETIRKSVFELIGKPYNERDAVPFIAIVSEPKDYVNHLTGEVVHKEDVDFLSRLYFRNQIHLTYSGSSSCCTSSAAVIPGTVVNEVCRQREPNKIIIGHPAGTMDVDVVYAEEDGKPTIKKVAYARTARRIMDGHCYVPNRFFEKK